MKSIPHSKKLKELIKTLREDPRTKEALDKLKASASSSRQARNFKELLLQLIRIGSKFMGKKKSRILEGWIDAVNLIVELSFFLKENVFDRPEVKAFFQKGWSGAKSQGASIYKTARGYVARALARGR